MYLDMCYSVSGPFGAPFLNDRSCLRWAKHNLNLGIKTEPVTARADAASGFSSGLGTPFFSVQYVTFFSVLKKEHSILFRSFLEFLQGWASVLFKRMFHSLRSFPFF